MSEIGKMLIGLGLLILLIGLLLVAAGRFNLPLGRLPGDIVYRGKNSSFYFPIVTCIVISIVLSLIGYIARWFR